MALLAMTVLLIVLLITVGSLISIDLAWVISLAL